MNLSPATVYLWFTFVEDIQDEKLLSEYRRLLPASELEKLERYRFDKHRKRYLVGRALIRTILSRCTGLVPKQITFSRGDYGRPFLLPFGTSPPPEFNLSYTDGLVAAALSLECRVGIDVENTSREIDCLEIAERYFSTAEYMELQQLPKPLLKERFFELWTLKEAYVKAQGGGLHTPLDEVSFHLRDANNDPVKSTYVVTDDGRQWQFRTLKPSDRHKASFCVRRNAESPLRVISKKTIPLIAEDDFIMYKDRYKL